MTTRLISISLGWLLLASWTPGLFSQTILSAPTLQQLNQKLHLTREQREKLAPILQRQAQQLQALEEDESLTQLQRVLDAMDIRQSFRPKVEAILTDDQRAQLIRSKPQTARGNQTASSLQAH